MPQRLWVRVLWSHKVWLLSCIQSLTKKYVVSGESSRHIQRGGGGWEWAFLGQLARSTGVCICLFPQAGEALDRPISGSIHQGWHPWGWGWGSMWQEHKASSASFSLSTVFCLTPASCPAEAAGGGDPALSLGGLRRLASKAQLKVRETHLG